ncbi:MAG: type transport system permease protein [Thermoplasmata archaeon]|nr:type transport system permease protein [Thermoplasmata archaeon]
MLLAHFVKDARLLLRNRALLAALMLYPVLLVVVLGAAFQTPPQKLDLALVNHDVADQLDVNGRNVTAEDMLVASNGFAHVVKATSDADGLARLRRGEVDAVLVVPAHFLNQLGTLGSNATVRLVVDESDPIHASVARNAVKGVLNDFLKAIVQEKIRGVLVLLNLTESGGVTNVLGQDVSVLGIHQARVELSQVKSSMAPNNPDAQRVQDVIDFLDFAGGVLGNSERYLTTTALPLQVQDSGLASQDTRLSTVALPGAIVLGVFWTGALSAALLAARERETGAARRLAAAPGARTWSLVSKLLVALLAALVPAAVALALGFALLGATVADPAMTLGVLLLASLAAGALGLLAAGLTRASSGAALLAVLALLPMLLLGGLFFPVAFMPAPARAVSSVLPVTLATDALRGAMLRGNALGEIAPEIAGLALVALLCGGAGAWLARRRAH